MATLAPIQGNISVRVGMTTPLTCATVGGTWTSSDNSKATVISGTGIVTGVAAGLVSIIYTVGADSTAITLTVTIRTLSNGLDIQRVYDVLKNRVKWRFLGAASDSLRYFEDFHTLCTPEILRDIQPNATISDGEFVQYLVDISRSEILETVNAIYSAPAIIDPATLCFFRLDNILYPQPVVNQNQFVGLKMMIVKGDHAVRFNSIELFFDKDCTFNMYLYNDMTLPPIYALEVSVLAYQQVIIDTSNDAILNYLSPSINKGGLVYFGYYQADIAAQGAHALYYPINMQVFHPCKIWSYSAQVVSSDQQGNRNFVRNNIGANNLTYGLNLEVTTYVDATNNIIQNAHLFDEVIGLQVAAKVVEAIIFNYRSNVTERNIESVSLEKLYNELNLARPSEDLPFSVGLRKKIERAIFQAKQSFQKIETTFVGIT